MCALFAATTFIIKKKLSKPNDERNLFVRILLGKGSKCVCKHMLALILHVQEGQSQAALLY